MLPHAVCPIGPHHECSDGNICTDKSPVAWRRDILSVDGAIDHAHIKIMLAAVNANGGEVHLSENQ